MTQVVKAWGYILGRTYQFVSYVSLYYSFVVCPLSLSHYAYHYLLLSLSVVFVIRKRGEEHTDMLGEGTWTNFILLDYLLESEEVSELLDVSMSSLTSLLLIFFLIIISQKFDSCWTGIM